MKIYANTHPYDSYRKFVLHRAILRKARLIRGCAFLNWTRSLFKMFFYGLNTTLTWNYI